MYILKGIILLLISLISFNKISIHFNVKKFEIINGLFNQQLDYSNCRSGMLMHILLKIKI